MATSCFVAAAVTFLLAFTQTEAQTQLGANWIPTDMNYALLSRLRASPLASPEDKLAGYSTLGIIPTDAVAAWIKQATSNPSFREGTVRWSPSTLAVSGWCVGSPGCVKSVHVTLLEYSFVNPNATDCKAYGLVAADAVLPQQAVLTDGTRAFQPLQPILYEITAAPNSTNTSCTYVVQYPNATRVLANQLCDQSCYNSACQPCNANQTITGADPPTNCTPNSGLPPAMVAAIQGAAQCLGTGGLGRYQCQVAVSGNSSVCAAMGCFPGDSSVTVEGGRKLRMQDVRIGDRVQVALSNGELAYEDVYFFGHRDAQTWGKFVKLTLQSNSSGKVIELSEKHFLPASRGRQSWATAKQHRAQDVQVGDTIWAEGEAGVLEPFQVAAKEMISKQGLWAPYTASGTVVVNGVVASVHSDWYLDGLLDLFGRPDLLPALYQALLAPVRLLYKVLGCHKMRTMDATYDFGNIVTFPLAAIRETTLPLSFGLSVGVVPFGLHLRSQLKGFYAQAAAFCRYPGNVGH